MKQPPWTMCGGIGSGGRHRSACMKEQRTSWRSVLPFVLSVGVASLALLAVPAFAVNAAAPTGEDAAVQPVNPYAKISDQTLTDLAARIDELDPDNKQALISEIKMRMARQGSTDGVLRVRLPRRYGTVVRRVRIEIRKVPKDRQKYGLGFEQRSAQAVEKQATPVVKVTDSN